MCYVWKFFFLKSLRILKPIHMPNHFPASLQPSFRWMIICIVCYQMWLNQLFFTISAWNKYMCLWPDCKFSNHFWNKEISNSIICNWYFRIQSILYHSASYIFSYISVLFQTVSRNPGWSLSHAAISESRCLIISSLSCGRTPLIVIRLYGWLPKKMQSFIFNARSSIFSSSTSSRSVSCAYSPLSQSSSSSLPRKNRCWKRRLHGMADTCSEERRSFYTFFAYALFTNSKH